LGSSSTGGALSVGIALLRLQMLLAGAWGGHVQRGMRRAGGQPPSPDFGRVDPRPPRGGRESLPL